LDSLKKHSASEASLFEQFNCLYLVPTRELVHNQGIRLLEQFQMESIRLHGGVEHAFAVPIKAQNDGSARRFVSNFDDFAGLPAFAVYTRGMLVMLTVNVALAWGLYNGAVGKIRDIIFGPNCGPTEDGTSWPIVILVEFKKYSGPIVISSETSVVPVYPEERCGVNNVRGRRLSGTRRAFPLKCAFSSTVHKAQGCTCGESHPFERILVDLGDTKTESWAASLGFVALSRATEGSRVCINGDITLTRVQQMSGGSVSRIVRKEDKRLKLIHEATVRNLNHSESSFEDLIAWFFSRSTSSTSVQVSHNVILLRYSFTLDSHFFCSQQPPPPPAPPPPPPLI
jgi:hypothetical protein